MNLKEALDRRAANPLLVLAGGTDFYPSLGDKSPPSDVIDTTGIKELQGISVDASGWRIGAACTWTELIKAELPPVFDALKAAAREVGSVQIQNAATIAGNLCNASPAADGVPPLLALDAQVELASRRGRRILPLAEFILGVRHTALADDELLIAIHVPSQSDDARSVFTKLGARRYLVISIAMIAVTLVRHNGKISDARIAVGSCSPVACRLEALESSIKGQELQALTADAVSQIVWQAELSELTPIDDVRGSANYRHQAVREMLARLLVDCAQQWENVSA